MKRLAKATFTGSLARLRNLTFGLAVAMALMVSPALAVETHPYTGVSFGPDGTDSTTFTRVDGVAVDQTNHFVYVYDGHAETIYKFDLTGAPVPFSSTGTNALTGLGGGPEDGALEIAVAPAGAPGGTAGDIYVATNTVVSIFNAAGEPIGILSGGETCGVATNSAGHIFVGIFQSEDQSEVREYVPAANPPTNADLQATSTAPLPEICNVAADGLGNVYAANYAGSRGLVKLEGLGAATAIAVDPTAISMAVDPASNDLYAASSSGFRQYDSSGNLLNVSGTARLTGSQGIAVDSSTETVYVGNESNHQVDIFGPTEVKVPGPKIQSAQAVTVNGEDAVIRAQIKPEGEPTTAYVEFGSTTAYGEKTTVQTVGEDELSHRVDFILRNLKPGTSYHWRVVASNSQVAESSDQTFRTLFNAEREINCENQAKRTGPSATLPDCRAYELVTPVDKGGIDIGPSFDIGLDPNELNQTSTSGNALTFSSAQGIGDVEGAAYTPQYLSVRASGGWETRSLATSQRFARTRAGGRVTFEYLLFTPDLCHGFLQNFSATPIAPGAAVGYANLYKRDGCGDSGVVGLTPGNREMNPPDNTIAPLLAGISSDGVCATYFLLQPSQATLEESEFEGVRENCDGKIRQVNILPNGKISRYGSVGTVDVAIDQFQAMRTSILKNAMSEDGSTIYWSSGPASVAAPLYVRVNARQEQSALGPDDECLEAQKACTLPVSGTGEEGAPAIFMGASSDGSRAFFKFIGGPLENDLFEYDLATQSSHLIAHKVPARLFALEDPNRFLWLSRDGQKAYFISKDAIGGEGTDGHANLYFYDATAGTEGETRLAADFQGGHVANAGVSRDGSSAVFETDSQLTPYDNRDANSGEPAREVYVLYAPTGSGAARIVCASCNPTGQRPDAAHPIVHRVPVDYFASGVIPGPETNFQTPRAITDDGTRVFFESYERLIAQDSNGRVDVYEWTQEGAHGCVPSASTYSPINQGCLALVSSGESSGNSRLIDATADGSDVFFATAQSLLPQDPGLVDIYDARVEGGFPPPAAPAAGCEGEACQGPLSPPNDPTPASSVFQGAGNVRPEAHAKHRKHHRKHRKRHEKDGQKSRTSHSGRTTR